jgi:hypothetical protein
LLINSLSNLSAYKFCRKAIPIPTAVLSSVAHIIASGSHLLKPTRQERLKADSIAMYSSKISLVANSFIQTVEALKKNRIVEAFARFIEPVFLLFEKRVEDLGLARGFAIGVSQLVGSQEGIYNFLAEKNYGKNIAKGDAVSLGQDLQLNFTAFTKLLSENIHGVFNGQRRFLTAFNFENIKKSFTGFWKDLNLASLSDLFDFSRSNYRERFKAFLGNSGLGHLQDLCRGNNEFDKGHTEAFSGYLMTAGSLLAYIDKAKRGMFYKVGGFFRNLGGAIGDVGFLGHKDTDINIASLFLFLNSGMDILQRFIPGKYLNMLLPWSNLSMAAYNIGSVIYLNRSNQKSNEANEIAYHDTDLALAA